MKWPFITISLQTVLPIANLLGKIVYWMTHIYILLLVTID